MRFLDFLQGFQVMLLRRHLQVPRYEVIFILGAELPENPALLIPGLLAWLNLLHNATICFSFFLIVQTIKMYKYIYWTFKLPEHACSRPA